MHIRKSFGYVLWSFGALAAMLPAAGAVAQSPAPVAADSGADLEVIVVTARRRVEDVQKTPVSITAFSAQDLKDKAFQNATDLALATPSLQIFPNATNPGGLQISMRGLVQTDTASNSPGSVGLYIDDIYEAGSGIAGGLLNFNDMERVEVLKGPQGTLYGRNVTAGLVKFVTKRPTNDFDASVTLGTGNYGRYNVNAMVNLPIISDMLAARFVINSEGHNGYSQDIVNNRPMDDLHKTGLRGTIEFKPTESLEFVLSGWAARGKDSGADVRSTYLQPGLNIAAFDIMASQHINGITPGTLAPLIFCPAGPGPTCPFPATTFLGAVGAALAALPQTAALVQQQLNASRSQVLGAPASLPLGDSSHRTGGSFTAAYDFGKLTLKSISGVSYDSRNSYFNVGGGPWIPIYTNQGGSIREFTEELQATGLALDDKLKYAVGFFYLDAKLDDSRHDSSQFGAFPLFLGKFGLNIDNGQQDHNYLKTKSSAVYTQASYAITSTVNVTGGLRWTTEKNSNTTNLVQLGSVGTGFQPVCIGPAPLTASTPVDQCFASADVTANNVSYTYGFDWSPTDSVMLYAKSSRGFKAGGVNAYPPPYTDFTTYKPELATDYEIGIKSQWLENRLRLNADIYHTDYSNIQRTPSKVIGVAPNSQIITETENAAKAKINGAEVELTVVPLPGLTLSTTAAYISPYFENYRVANSNFPSGFIDNSNQPFQGVAKWQNTVSAAYVYKAGWGDLRTAVDWVHRSDANLFANDTNPVTPGGPFAPASTTTQPGYGLTNATMTADLPRLHSSVTIWGRNLGDKRYLASLISLLNNNAGIAFGNYGEPRTYGVDYTYSFK